MTPETLTDAIREAKRFIDLAQAAKKRINQDGYIVGTSESGAARRSSMDLTRALARMRRPS